MRPCMALYQELAFSSIGPIDASSITLLLKRASPAAPSTPYLVIGCMVITIKSGKWEKTSAEEFLVLETIGYIILYDIVPNKRLF